MDEIKIKRTATLRNQQVGFEKHDLRLGIAQINELQETTNCGIFKLMSKFVLRDVTLNDVRSVIRCGLWGAGMAPERANSLVETWVDSGYLMDNYVIALEVLSLSMEGTPEEPLTDKADVDDGSKKKTTE